MITLWVYSVVNMYLQKYIIYNVLLFSFQNAQLPKKKFLVLVSILL